MNRNGRSTNDPKEETIKFRINSDKAEALKQIAKSRSITLSQLMRILTDEAISKKR